MKSTGSTSFASSISESTDGGWTRPIPTTSRRKATSSSRPRSDSPGARFAAHIRSPAPSPSPRASGSATTGVRSGSEGRRRGVRRGGDGSAGNVWHDRRGRASLRRREGVGSLRPTVFHFPVDRRFSAVAKCGEADSPAGLRVPCVHRAVLNVLPDILHKQRRRNERRETP